MFCLGLGVSIQFQEKPLASYCLGVAQVCRPCVQAHLRYPFLLVSLVEVGAQKVEAAEVVVAQREAEAEAVAPTDLLDSEVKQVTMDSSD